EISFLLPAIRVQVLAKIPELIEKGDANQWQAIVARGLHVIAGKNAEPTGVYGHALGEAVLGREVGDEFALLIFIFGDRFHVSVETLAGKLVLNEVAGVRGGTFECRLR